MEVVMTEKLYYKDVYIKEFTAEVISCEKEDKNYAVVLDRTAFYPTGGGQPHDTGYIYYCNKKIEVIDVNEKDDIIYHTTNEPIPVGENVNGEIDWDRRFDHMQQHAGEHMMAGCIYNLFGGVTQGLHLGKEISTIDVLMPDGRMRLNDDEIYKLETLLNDRIQTDAPIRCFFPSNEEIKTLPLRKPPTVDEGIRVVAAGDFEMVPCAGTHPTTTGQVGLVKVLSTTPSKGFMRVSFVAGKRAVKYFMDLYISSSEAAVKLSCGHEALPKAVDKLQQDIKNLKEELVAYQKKEVNFLADKLLNNAEVLPKGRLIAEKLPEEFTSLKQLAIRLAENDDVVALLQCGKNIAFSRGKGIDISMPDIIKQSGGRGGGSPDFAQGVAIDDGCIKNTESLARELLGADIAEN
jgi:alanyl-tRNA synthetase